MFQEPEKSNIIQGIENGWDVEQIIGATGSTDDLLFLVKWKDHPISELVPNKLCREKFTNALLDFYEKNLKWEDE